MGMCIYPTHSLHLIRDSPTYIGFMGRVSPRVRASPKSVQRKRELRASLISVVISPMGFMQHKNWCNLHTVGDSTNFVKLAIKTEHLLVGRGVTAYYNMPSSYTTKKIKWFLCECTIHNTHSIRHQALVQCG